MHGRLVSVTETPRDNIQEDGLLLAFPMVQELFSEGYINNFPKGHSYWKLKQQLSNWGASHQKKQPDHENSHSPQDPQPSTCPDKNNIGVNDNHSENSITVSAKENSTTSSSVITTNGVVHLPQNAATVSAKENSTTSSSVAAATAQSPAPVSPETTGVLPVSFQDTSGPKPCSDAQEIIALPEGKAVPTTISPPETIAALDTIPNDSPVPVVPVISTSTVASTNQISSLTTDQATTSKQTLSELEQAEILRKVLEILNSINM
ncbi:hypothetical protein H671_1g3722 [Cricetulus griseus]|uniref:Uncharacterized protein n=1 Tax=Cricetulus griseus TaxID=10029 RepID=A0A061IG53_CRIGR|nr:hypothetical protein H671_1g3722 [Cricetulus griseus]